MGSDQDRLKMKHHGCSSKKKVASKNCSRDLADILANMQQQVSQLRQEIAVMRSNTLSSTESSEVACEIGTKQVPAKIKIYMNDGETFVIPVSFDSSNLSSTAEKNDSSVSVSISETNKVRAMKSSVNLHAKVSLTSELTTASVSSLNLECSSCESKCFNIENPRLEFTE